MKLTEKQIDKLARRVAEYVKNQLRQDFGDGDMLRVKYEVTINGNLSR